MVLTNNDDYVRPAMRHLELKCNAIDEEDDEITLEVPLMFI